MPRPVPSFCYRVVLRPPEIPPAQKVESGHDGTQPETKPAIPPSLPGDIAPVERPQGLEDQVMRPRAPPARLPCLRLVARELDLLREELSPAFIIDVDERLAKVSRRPAQPRDLVNGFGGIVVGGITAQQAKLVVGRPAGIADFTLPRKEIAPRHPPSDLRAVIHDRLPDLTSQRRCDSLVRIDEEDPAPCCELQGPLALHRIVDPGPHLNPRPGSPRQFLRSVPAAAIDDQHLVGPTDAREALAYVTALVAGEDRGRYGRPVHRVATSLYAVSRRSSSFGSSLPAPASRRACR